MQRSSRGTTGAGSGVRTSRFLRGVTAATAAILVWAVLPLASAGAAQAEAYVDPVCDPASPDYDPADPYCDEPAPGTTLPAPSVTVYSAPTAWTPTWNEYADDLPDFVTGPTTFTITVTGPNPVCAMTFMGQTDTAAPWQFTADPFAESWASEVAVSLCDGGADSLYVGWPQLPFQLSQAVVNAGTGRQRVRVGNRMPTPATATLTDGRGRVVSTATVPADGDGTITVPTKGIRRTTTFTLAMDGSGLQMTTRVIVAVGWAVLGGGQMATPYDQCQTVTWSLATRGLPRSVNRASFLRDIKRSLARIAANTNLRFVRYSGNPADARLRYEWRKLGSGGLGGFGSTSGEVEFNSQSAWVAEKYRGFATRYGSPSGRGWLIVHETMHTMGLGHVNDRASIMAPTNVGQDAFTRGDLEGLRALYPPGTCPS